MSKRYLEYRDEGDQFAAHLGDVKKSALHFFGPVDDEEAAFEEECCPFAPIEVEHMRGFLPVG
jgi:hypothetical protein